MQGLGNDFVLLDCRGKTFDLTTAELQFLADRKFGVGCDQILVIEDPLDNGYDFIYRIFNADGSEAGHCGNGARCVIQYLWDKVNKSQIVLRIQKQNITGRRNGDGTITVNMGSPAFNPSDLPFLHAITSNNRYELNLDAIKINFGICSVGNPHVLIRLNILQELENDSKLSKIGKLLQESALFPESVNVNFYTVISPSQIKLRTYERGCGFTLACGTGATATASYAILQNEVNNNVALEMPGGKLNIAWDGVNEILMTGAAVLVFDGQLCI